MGKSDLESYGPCLNFLYEMLGPNAEVILYDIKTMRVHSVVNPFDAEMAPGSEMRSLEREFLAQKLYEQQDFIVNYRAISKFQNKLKSATYFIKDKKGELKAMLTININVDKLLELRDMLDVLVSGYQPYDSGGTRSFYNSFDVSVEDMVASAVREELNKFGVEPPRLSANEKLDIVRSLDAKGIFLIKGSISHVAEVMQTTETTIYRYLNKISTT